MHKVFSSAPEHIQLLISSCSFCPREALQILPSLLYPLQWFKALYCFPSGAAASCLLSLLSLFSPSVLSPGPNGFPLAIVIYNMDLNLLFLGLEIIIEGRKFLSKLWTQLSNSEKMLQSLQEMAVALLFTSTEGGSSTRCVNCLLVYNKMLHVCTV